MAAGLDCRLTACMLGLYYPKEAPAKDCLMSFSLIKRLLVIALAVLRCIPTLGSVSGDAIFHSQLEGKGSDKVHHHECLGRAVSIPPWIRVPWPSDGRTLSTGTSLHWGEGRERAQHTLMAATAPTAPVGRSCCSQV